MKNLIEIKDKVSNAVFGQAWDRLTDKQRLLIFDQVSMDYFGQFDARISELKAELKEDIELLNLLSERPDCSLSEIELIKRRINNLDKQFSKGA